MEIRTKSVFKSLLIFTIIILFVASCGLFRKEAQEPEVTEKPTGVNPAIAEGRINVSKIENKRQLAYGVMAQGYIGDYVLENEKFRAVITAPQNEITGNEEGGHLVDLCLQKYKYDYIQSIFPNIGVGLRPNYRYENIEIRTTGYSDNGAALIVNGRSKTDSLNFLIETEYIIRPEKSYIEMITRVTNSANETLKSLKLGDNCNWGYGISFIGNFGTISPGDSEMLKNLDWYSVFVDDFSAGITQKDGDIEGTFAERWVKAVNKTVDLSPGETVSYQRYLYVSDKDMADISDFAYEMRVEKYGFISGRVVEKGTDTPVPGVDVRFIISRLGDTAVPAKPYTRTYSNELGEFQVMVPEGQYFVRARAFARREARNFFSFFVPDGDTYVLRMEVSPPSKLKFTCRDEDTREFLPCKMTFINIPPTDFIDRGTGEDLYCRNVYFSGTGNETIDFPTGRYRVIFSRGIEYDTYEEEILVTYNNENSIDALLNRVVDPGNAISVDLGVETDASYDCYVSPEARVITAAAEGVEYLITGDTNVATNLKPALEAAGLGKFLNVMTGKKIELIGDNNMGQFQVWPLDGMSQEVLDSEIKAENPADFFSSLRDNYPESLIQVDRPIFPIDGYFTRYGYDAEGEKRVVEDEEFSYDFDLLSVWEDKRFGAAEESQKLMFDTWLSGYNTIKPVAGSYSRKTWGEEVGYPRMYVTTGKNDPSRVTPNEIRDGLKQGNYFITNGPMIEFTINDQAPGSLITDTDGKVDCHLIVRAAPWVPVSYVEIKIDGVFLRRIILAPSRDIMRFPRTEEKMADANFEVNVRKDSIISIEVVGKGRNSLHPVVSAFPSGEEPMALAFTAPIFIDFDGNGKYDPPVEEDIGM